MRGVLGLLVLCVANTMVSAQSVEQRSSPTEKTTEQIQAIEKRVADWLTTCLQDWDADTHMTQEEWRTTCKRVAVERRTFLLRNEVPGDEMLRRR